MGHSSLSENSQTNLVIHYESEQSRFLHESEIGPRRDFARVQVAHSNSLHRPTESCLVCCVFEWTKEKAKEKDRKKTSSFRCLLNGQDLFCVYKAHSGTLQICCWGLFVLCCWGCGQIAPTINNHEVPSQACVWGSEHKSSKYAQY